MQYKSMYSKGVNNVRHFDFGDARATKLREGRQELVLLTRCQLNDSILQVSKINTVNGLLSSRQDLRKLRCCIKCVNTTTFLYYGEFWNQLSTLQSKKIINIIIIEIV